MTIHTILPAGHYWIGDPCYLFPHEGPMGEKWGELLDNNVETTEEGSPWTLDSGKIRIWTEGTAYGDGLYRDDFGNLFGVDSGLLGIATQETVDYLDNDKEYVKRCGLFIEFKEPFLVEIDSGRFKFGHIFIDTGDVGDEEEFE